MPSPVISGRTPRMFGSCGWLGVSKDGGPHDSVLRVGRRDRARPRVLVAAALAGEYGRAGARRLLAECRGGGAARLGADGLRDLSEGSALVAVTNGDSEMNDLRLLGSKVRDRVTGAVGVVE